MFRFLTLVLSCAAGLASPRGHDQPLSPAEEMKTFTVEPGLTVELVASEPLTVAPVAVSFDAAGQMYVAENRGYPNSARPLAGRIALLQDTDQDGFFETRSEFAEGLSFPNGVLAWKSGVIVTCAPDVLYLEDQDGDGKADIRKVLLTGFATNTTTQLQASHPTFAPDGWVYISGGLSGGSITSPLRPGAPAVDISRSEIRFDPETGEYEAVDGKGQFGLAFTDFGHRFTCMNRIHIQHVVISGRYLERNPHLAFTDRIQNVPETLDPGLGLGAPAARLFPISQNLTTADSHAGAFTAACGVTLYPGLSLPEVMENNVFTCDPAANLVHRDVLHRSGATFSARPGIEGSEFLASSDDWFRPVNLQAGPDGALYICDMYRRTIEHPDYLPEEVRKRTDFGGGTNCGRIFRVRSIGSASMAARIQRLDANAPASLIANLSHANRWVRETAHRLLVERRATTPEIADSLKKLVRESADGTSKVERAFGTARALRLLARWNALDEEVLLSAIHHRHPGVRQVAIELSEQAMNSGGAGHLRQAVAKATEDEDSQVRFQAALALGSLRDRELRVKALGECLERSADRWTRAAVFSSANGVEYELLRELLGSGGIRRPEHSPTITELARLARKAQGSGGASTDLSWLEKTTPGLAMAVLNGWFAGDKAVPLTFRKKAFWNTLQNEAVKLAGSPEGPLEARSTAIRFTRFLGETDQRRLLVLLAPGTPLELQREIIRVLSEGRNPEQLFQVLEGKTWRALSPVLREQVISAIISRSSLATGLLRRIEAGEISGNVVSPAQKRQLRSHGDARIAQLISRIFAAESEEDRSKIYDDYRSVVDLGADAANGREVFRRACSSCHRLDQEGIAVGPDLFSIRNQPKETILLHIIDPDREIAPGFNSYTLELNDGRSLSGVIRSETDSALTIRTAAGQDEVIQRSMVESLIASSLSMMPRELEKSMSRQELADLLAFLRGEQGGAGAR